MRKLYTFCLLLLFHIAGWAQQSDYIIIKKQNNKTIKTYFEGSFISAFTYDGFHINGFITAIRNDSIILKQHETRLVGADFGSKIDTLVYTIGVYYGQIKKFEFSGNDIAGRKKGFLSITGPRLLIIGGIGFIGLELVNTAYRRESLTENNKLTSLGIAAGVAASGFLWNYINKSRNKVGGKYKIVYVKAIASNNSK